MVNHAAGTVVPSRSGEPPYPANRTDAQILEQAVRQSITTDPAAFLKTSEDVQNRAPDYWHKEIDSATWVVIQKGVEVVGIAVARFPDLEVDRNINRTRSRFIESVWIAPEFRGRGLGERLVRFLFETEWSESPDVRQFLLWVLEKNDPAIKLYKRMGFRRVGEQKLPDLSGRTEFRYEYVLDPDQAQMEAAVGERQADLRKEGLTYRVLGDGKTA
jgi:ribosomal protein S18 acetylase RimI-like enzyme